MSRRRGNQEGPVSLFSFQDIITAITGIMLLVVMLLALELLQSEMGPSEAESEPHRQRLKQRVEDMEREKERLEARVRELQDDMGAELFTESPHELKRKIRGAQEKQRELKRDIARRTGERNTAVKLQETREKALVDLREKLRAIEMQYEELDERYRELRATPRVEYEISGATNKAPILVECEEERIMARQGMETKKTKIFGGTDFVATFRNWAMERSSSRVAFFVLVKPDSASYAKPDIVEPLNEAGYQVGYEPLEQNLSALSRGDGS